MLKSCRLITYAAGVYVKVCSSNRSSWSMKQTTKTKEKRRKKNMKKFIICMVDTTDNSYDYELDGCWTDNIEVVQLWLNAGVQQFVLLDALSMELVASYDAAEMQVYIDGVLEH